MRAGMRSLGAIHLQLPLQAERRRRPAHGRERQERLNQVEPFVRQDSNPINFVSNFVGLVNRFDRTPSLPVGVDIAIPAFRNTLTTLGVEAPALDPNTFGRELVAAVAICFPTESGSMVFGDAAMRMCATISWFMAGASEAEQRAMGTWTSASYNLYMMAPLERMAFLQKQANAAQFTTAASLRKSTELPVITVEEIVAATLEATAERAITNDFGLGGNLLRQRGRRRRLHLGRPGADHPARRCTYGVTSSSTARRKQPTAPHQSLQ
jgi:hypothetical protein